MSAGHGDCLARGAMKASFGMGNVSKEKWDSIFGPDDEAQAVNPPEPVKETPADITGEK